MRHRYLTRNRRSLSDVKFDAPEEHQLTLRRYAVQIGGFVVLGHLAAATGALLVGPVPGWPLAVAGILIAWAGLEASARTPSWKGSVGGHLVASVGVGLFVGPLFFQPALIWLRTAALAVLFGTMVLTAVAAVAPGLVRAFGSFILALPLASGFLWLTQGFWSRALGAPAPGAASTIAALLFLAYTDRYWTRALRLPRTLDNAADSACALYADTVHSFLVMIERMTIRGRRGF